MPYVFTQCCIPATRHRQTRPALIPAMEANTQFTYPKGMKG